MITKAMHLLAAKGSYTVATEIPYHGYQDANFTQGQRR